LATLLFAFLAPKYNWLVVQASNGLIALLERPYQRTILKAEGEETLLLSRYFGREEVLTPRVRYNYELYYGLVLLLALLLATPGIRLLKRFELALIALCAVFAFHVVDITVIARNEKVIYHNPSEFFYDPLRVFEFLSPAVSVLLWGLLTFKYWLPLPKTVMNPDLKPAKAKLRPNDPCPCGSGKKYKHCCGRQSR
jgi:hypothetical protein